MHSSATPVSAGKHTVSTACMGVLAGLVCLSSSVQAEDYTLNREPSGSAGTVNDWLRSEYPEAAAWDVGGQFRIRYEAREGAGSFPNNDFVRGQNNNNEYLLMRTKVHLGFAPQDWVTVYLEGRDAHSVWDKRAGDPDTDTFDLYQAYLRLGNPEAFPITLTLGRQAMAYGEERYVGLREWSNTGRVYDAARLHWAGSWGWVDAFTSRPVVSQDGRFNVENDYEVLSGIYASTPVLMDWQDTDLYLLSHNVQQGSVNAIAPGLGGPAPRDVLTFGTRWKSRPDKTGNWDYTAEVSGQLGSISSASGRLAQHAYAIDLVGGYTWKENALKPRVAVGYDFASGDSNPNDKQSSTFDLVLGNRHDLYGLMDLFGSRNMHIPYVQGSIAPMKELTISLQALSFFIADTADFLYPETGPGRVGNGYGRNPGFDSYVGSEVELIVTQQLSERGVFQVGYGHFFTGSYIEQSVDSVPTNHGTKDADWFFAMFTLKF